MLSICINNIGDFPMLTLPKSLSDCKDKNEYVVSNEWFTIDSTHSGYNITIGREYTVYGILMYNDTIRYLIFNDDNIPCFFHSDLFSVLDNDIMWDWKIQRYSINDKNCLLLAYPQLTESYSNLIGIITGNPINIKQLLEYKDKLLF